MLFPLEITPLLVVTDVRSATVTNYLPTTVTTVIPQTITVTTTATPQIITTNTLLTTLLTTVVGCSPIEGECTGGLTTVGILSLKLCAVETTNI
jgi:hypothetical protein